MSNYYSHIIPGELYKVKNGDSLWRIAQWKYGDGNLWTEIKKINPDKVGMTGMIIVGTMLYLPSLPKRKNKRNPIEGYPIDLKGAGANGLAVELGFPGMRYTKKTTKFKKTQKIDFLIITGELEINLKFKIQKLGVTTNIDIDKYTMECEKTIIELFEKHLEFKFKLPVNLQTKLPETKNIELSLVVKGTTQEFKFKWKPFEGNKLAFECEDALINYEKNGVRYIVSTGFTFYLSFEIDQDEFKKFLLATILAVTIIVGIITFGPAIAAGGLAISEFIIAEGVTFAILAREFPRLFSPVLPALK